MKAKGGKGVAIHSIVPEEEPLLRPNSKPKRSYENKNLTIDHELIQIYLLGIAYHFSFTTAVLASSEIYIRLRKRPEGRCFPW